MLECHYKKEPLDLRLILLRLWKQAGIIIAVTIVGTLLFGGGYYLRNVVIPPTQYAAMSLYHITYEMPTNASPVLDPGYYYINDATWDRLMDTKEFLDLLYANLEGTTDGQIDRKTMKAYLSAELLTDLKMPDTIVITPDPQLSLRIAAAVEKSVQAMVGEKYGITEVRVIDPADHVKVFNEARPLNACILSGVTSFLTIIAILLLKEIGSDAIWLPATLTMRYGLKSFGTVKSKVFAENVNYLLRGCHKIGILPIGDVEIVEAEACLKEVDEENREYVSLPEGELCPKVYEVMRRMDGLVLVVSARAGSGKRLEEVLSVLQTQDCNVTGALLWHADECLIRRYYWKEALIGGKR